MASEIGPHTVIYPRICSWCLKKDITTIVGYSPKNNSNGMCKQCRIDVQKRYMKNKGGKQLMW